MIYDQASNNKLFLIEVLAQRYRWAFYFVEFVPPMLIPDSHTFPAV